MYKIQNRILPRDGLFLLCLVSILTVSCAGAGKGAVKGAGAGALAGAASGLVTSLIWGGDPGYHMARGATAGATIGAIGGAVEGSARAREKADREAAKKQRDIDQLRRDIGDDAFNAAEAMADCKHAVAIANADVAIQSRNANHALAGLWIKALTYADQGNSSAAQDVFPEIIRWDRDVESAEQAGEIVHEALGQLKVIRSEFHLPQTCS
jgi:hypothetical protein